MRISTTDPLTMKISDLRLNKCWFRSVELADNPTFSSKSGLGTTNLDVATNVARKSDGSREWKVDLKIKSDDSEPSTGPYRFSVELSGIFQIDDGYPESKLESLVQANGPAVLFGAAREMITLISSRGAQPALILPLVTFIDQIKTPEAPAKEKALAKK